MTQTGIPFVFMRGGTSRGPYFNRADLPGDRETLAEVLMAAIGAGHAINIDGIGGGVAVTTKVAMLSPSEDDWADVDYFFAQVSVADRLVDFKPTCGNILAGVGPAAIEMGLITPTGDETEVKIRAVNTGARVVARVQTPGASCAMTVAPRLQAFPVWRRPFRLASWAWSGHRQVRSFRRDICAIGSTGSRSPVWTSRCRWSLPVPGILA